MARLAGALGILLFSSAMLNLVLLIGEPGPAPEPAVPPGRSDPVEKQATETEVLVPETVAAVADLPDSSKDNELTELRERLRKQDRELRLYKAHFFRENPDASGLVELPPLPEPGDNPLSQEASKKLNRKIAVCLENRPALELVELIRRECGADFIYDPTVQARLSSRSVTMALKEVEALAALNFMGRMCGFKIEYLNGTVWIRNGDPSDE